MEPIMQDQIVSLNMFLKANSSKHPTTIFVLKVFLKTIYFSTNLSLAE